MKLYVLSADGKWGDRGTGRAFCKESKVFPLLIHFRREDAAEDAVSKVIAVQTDVAYHLQGKTIISWAEKAIPPLSAVEMALSFAEPSGCNEVWKRICLATRSGEKQDASNRTPTAPEAEKVGSPGAGPSSRPVLWADFVGETESADQSSVAEENGDESFQSSGIMMLANSAQPLVALTTSSAMDLPPVKMVIPPPNRASLGQLLQSLTEHFSLAKSLRDRLCAELIAENYVDRLTDLFGECEEDGDTNALSQLCLIFRSMCLAGNHPLAKVLCDRTYVMDVIGCLEYDSESLVEAGLRDKRLDEEKEDSSSPGVCISAGKSDSDSKCSASENEFKRMETSPSCEANGKSVLEPPKNAEPQPSKPLPVCRSKAAFAALPIASQPCPLSPSLTSAPKLPGTPRPGSSAKEAELLRLPGTPLPSKSALSELPRSIPNASSASDSVLKTGNAASSFRKPAVEVGAPSADSKLESPGPGRTQLPGSPSPEVTSSGNSDSGDGVPATLEVSVRVADSLPSLDLKKCTGVAKSDGPSQDRTQSTADSDLSSGDLLRCDESASPDDNVSRSTAAQAGSPPLASMEDLGSDGEDKSGILEGNKAFVRLTKHREFLEDRSTYKAVLRFADHAILSKIHTNFVIGYIKNVIFARAIEDTYSSSFGMVVNCNNADILLHILRNSQLLRDLFQKVTGFFEMRSRKRSSVDSSDNPKSPKRQRVELSTSSGESARSIQQVCTDRESVVCPSPMESEALPEANGCPITKFEPNSSPPAWLIQEICDALQFLVQLCEISKNQGTLRTQLFCTLRSCGILDLCVLALKDKLEEIRQLGSNLLNSVAVQDATELRKYMMNIVDDDVQDAVPPVAQSALSKTVRICLRSARTPIVSALLSNPSDKNSFLSEVSKDDDVTWKDGDLESKQVNAPSKDDGSASKCDSVVAQFLDSIAKNDDAVSKPIDAVSKPDGAVSKPDDAGSKGDDVAANNADDTPPVSDSSKEDMAVCNPPAPIAEKRDAEMCAVDTEPESVALEAKTPDVKEGGTTSSHKDKSLSPTEANSLYPLMATMVNVVCGDENIGVVLQVIDLLRGLMDTTSMRVEANRDTLTGEFYSHFAERLLPPIVEAGLGKDDGGADLKTLKFCRDDKIPYLCDFLSFCVANHSYVAKYFVLPNDVGGKVAKLLQHKKKCIRLSALRFLRTCIGMQDKAFDDYILRKELLTPIMEMYRENKHCDNLTSSAVLDLVDFVSKKRRRVLLEVIVEQFAQILEPSSALCSAFQTAKDTLHSIRNPRANGAVSMGSDLSLLNDLNLATEGRLEPGANGGGGVDQLVTNHMISLLSQPSDAAGPFVTGRHSMSLFFSDIRVPPAIDESGFPAADDLYNTFPDLLEIRENSNSVSLTASDMWLEPSPGDIEQQEQQEQSASKEDISSEFSEESKQDDVDDVNDEASRGPSNASVEVQKEGKDIGSSPDGSDIVMTEQSNEPGNEAMHRSPSTTEGEIGNNPEDAPSEAQVEKVLTCRASNAGNSTEAARSEGQDKKVVPDRSFEVAKLRSPPGSPGKRLRQKEADEGQSPKKARMSNDGSDATAEAGDRVCSNAEVAEKSAPKDVAEHSHEVAGSSSRIASDGGDDRNEDSNNSSEARATEEKSARVTEAR